jgi:hypothetical protein
MKRRVFPRRGFGSSDPEAALPEMLGVAVVEDPLAVRKLGEVEVGAEIHLEEPGSLVAEDDVPGLGADAGATSLAVAAKSTTSSMGTLSVAVLLRVGLADTRKWLRTTFARAPVLRA